MKMKISLLNAAIIVSICISFTIASAQGIEQKKHMTQLPTIEDVNASLERTLGYDPAVTWHIFAIRESEIPGIVDVLLSINKQESQHIYISSDIQSAIVGSMIPFGKNPFAPMRSMLQAADGPSRGGQNPPIHIVVFSDLECAHCNIAHPIIEKLMADFPQVQFTFQQYPLPASMHPWAMKAALYTDCAGQINKEAFWSYISSIFDNQDKITTASADNKLKDLAITAGLDAQKIAACAAKPETDARVKKSLELGQTLDVTSVPTVFINGRRVLSIGSIPYDSLKRLVQFEIDHAGR